MLDVRGSVSLVVFPNLPFPETVYLFVSECLLYALLGITVVASGGTLFLSSPCMHVYSVILIVVSSAYFSSSRHPDFE